MNSLGEVPGFAASMPVSGCRKAVSIGFFGGNDEIMISCEGQPLCDELSIVSDKKDIRSAL